jgi:hypothetical protein
MPASSAIGGALEGAGKASRGSTGEAVRENDESK